MLEIIPITNPRWKNSFRRKKFPVATEVFLLKEKTKLFQKGISLYDRNSCWQIKFLLQEIFPVAVGNHMLLEIIPVKKRHQKNPFLLYDGNSFWWIKFLLKEIFPVARRNYMLLEIIPVTKKAYKITFSGRNIYIAGRK